MTLCLSLAAAAPPQGTKCPAAVRGDLRERENEADT
jgi:hypothetical protein